MIKYDIKSRSWHRTDTTHLKNAIRVDRDKLKFFDEYAEGKTALHFGCVAGVNSELFDHFETVDGWDIEKRLDSLTPDIRERYNVLSEKAANFQDHYDFVFVQMVPGLISQLNLYRMIPWLAERADVLYIMTPQINPQLRTVTKFIIEALGYPVRSVWYDEPKKILEIVYDFRETESTEPEPIEEELDNGGDLGGQDEPDTDEEGLQAQESVGQSDLGDESSVDWEARGGLDSTEEI